jgi:hypothetical protein
VGFEGLSSKVDFLHDPHLVWNSFINLLAADKYDDLPAEQRAMPKHAVNANPLISFDDESLRVSNLRGGRESSLFEKRWSEVTVAIAYKRDCFSYDVICVAIETSTGAIEIHEQMRGWNSLVQALPERLPGCQKYEEWFTKVAQPPFATSQIEIFRRT